jgi:hypothetical protein
MVENIDWDEFKEFRLTSTKNQDNFLMMLDFLKSYYNLFSVYDIYNTLVNDETTKMMLEKRDIVDIESLEKFLFKKVV